eukprot:GEMP01046166.1.p1 GENE.GEMP01046166.1~~GEMP01046166.1.p1  ORF type:complete len:512 (+),score=136.74 GEMP01046166.1:68-1603(+)
MAHIAFFSSYKDPRDSVFAQSVHWNEDLDTYCTGEHAKEWPTRHFATFKALRSKQVTWKKSEKKGTGMWAGRAAGKGELLAEGEPPILVEQSQCSQRFFRCCAMCHKSVSSSVKQTLAHILGPDKMNLLESVDWSGIDNDAEKHVECPRCDAVFCSLECYDNANLETWHRVLCFEETVPGGWEKFRKFAHRTHSQFIMAAKIMAEIVVLVRFFGVSLPDACRNFCQFWKRPWLSNGYLEEEIAWLKKEQRTKQCTRALELLIDLLWDRQFADLFTVQFFSSLMGQFVATSIHVEFPHPLNDEVMSLRKTKAGQEIWEKCVAVMQKEYAMDGDTFDAEKLPPFVGTGLYRVVACANHSCLPSTEFSFSHGALVSLRTLQAVEEGEELFITYINCNLPLKQRLTRLYATWGFVCTCTKCQYQMLKQCVEEAKEGKTVVPPTTEEESEDEEDDNEEDQEDDAEEGEEGEEDEEGIDDESDDTDNEIKSITLPCELSSAVENIKMQVAELAKMEL